MSSMKTESEVYEIANDSEQPKFSPDASRVNETTVYHDDAHFGASFRYLEAMRREGQLCDVMLVVDSNEEGESDGSSGNRSLYKVSAHRCILAAACPYFSAMFGGAMVESGQKEIYLKGIDRVSLEAILDFMYSGSLKISENNVQKLFVTASIFQVSSVQDACGNFLKEQLDPSNCLGIAQFALLHSCLKLHSAAICFCRQHFWKLADFEEFLQLSKERLSELISFNHLNTNGEEKVYEAVLKWVRHDVENRQKFLPELMSHVRISVIPCQYLTENIDSEPLILQSPECKDYLLEAYRYHLTGETFPFCADEDFERFRPRMPVSPTRMIMLVGGQAPKAVTNVEVLNLDSVTWTSVNDLPQRRCRCGVAELNGSIYAVGGFNGSMRVRIADRFDLERGSWHAVTLMNERRSTLGVAAAANRLYAIGGYDGNTGLCTAEAYDPRAGDWIPLPLMSVRRSSVGVTAIGDLIYAIGGFDGCTKQSLNTVEIFETRMNTWRAGPSMHLKRSGAAVASFGKHIFAIGGHDGPEIRSCAEVLINGSWHRCLPPMSTPRRNASAVCIDSTLYILGGEDGKINLDSVEALDVSSFKNIAKTWTGVGIRMKQPKSYCGVALLSQPLGKEIYSEAYQANITTGAGDSFFY